MSDQSNNDLAQLFPGLAGILGAMEQAPPAQGALQADPDHAGVTDEMVDAFFTNNPQVRSLPPLVSGQQPTTQQFRSGSTGMPPAGGVEQPDGTFTQTAPPVQPPLGQPPTQPTIQAPPPQPPIATPGQPAPASQPPSQLTDDELSQLRELQTAIRSDPALRSKIADHLVGRATPPVPQPPVVTAPQGFQPVGQPAAAPTTPQVGPTGLEPMYPAVPQFVSQPPANLDLEDPSIAALWQMVQSQQQQLAATAQTVQNSAAIAQQNARQQSEGAYQAAKTGFATRYELNEADVTHLDGLAARLGVLPQLMSGIDPLTGLPVKNDLTSSIDRALEIAYFTDPNYRQREWDRQANVRRDDAQRQQKLAAVSGSSASVPRTTPAPTTEQGRRDALLGEVGAMLQGSWNDPAAN